MVSLEQEICGFRAGANSGLRPPTSVFTSWKLQWLSVRLVIERSLIRLPAGALSSQLSKLSLPSLQAGVRWGTFTCVGWQITLCDPIWQVAFVALRRSVIKSYISFYLFFFTFYQHRICHLLPMSSFNI